MSFDNNINPHYVYHVIKQAYNRNTDQFICWITNCGNRYTNVHHFVKHLFEQHRENGQLFYCHCGLPFISHAYLVNHLNKEHAEKTNHHANSNKQFTNLNNIQPTITVPSFLINPNCPRPQIVSNNLSSSCAQPQQQCFPTQPTFEPQNYPFNQDGFVPSLKNRNPILNQLLQRITKQRLQAINRLQGRQPASISREYRRILPKPGVQKQPDSESTTSHHFNNLPTIQVQPQITRPSFEPTYFSHKLKRAKYLLSTLNPVSNSTLQPVTETNIHPNPAPEPKIQTQPVFQTHLLSTPLSAGLTAQQATLAFQPQPELFIFSPFPSQTHQQFFALPHQAQPDLALDSIHSQPTTVPAVTPPSFSEVKPTQQSIGRSSAQSPPNKPLNYTVTQQFNVLIEQQISPSLVPELPTKADVSSSASKHRSPSPLLYLNKPYSPLKLCLHRHYKPRFKGVNSTKQPPIPLLRPAPQFSTVFICTGCKCFSRFPSGLDNHCSSEHNPPTVCKPILQCGRCKACFEVKAKLFRHMYKKHGEGKPLHCPGCRHIFWLFDDLLEHTNQCPFQFIK